MIKLVKVKQKGMNIFMEYNERIKELREDKDLNQTQLAKEIHSTQKTISNWEKGYSEPKIEMIKTLCKFFDVSADYLLGITDRERERTINNVKNQINGNNYGKITMK